MSIREFFQSVVKLCIIAMLAAVIILGAFSVGYLMRAAHGAELAGVVAQQPRPQAPGGDNVESPEFDVFWEAWGFIEQRFYGQIPSKQERVYGAVRGMVNAFGDQNTAFIDPTRAEIFRQDTAGTFEGIGAAVRMDEMGRLYIVEPYPGRPAAEAGLQPGDIILKVDGASVEGKSLYEAISLIRGPADTAVVLYVFRDGIDEPFDVRVVRARIEIEVIDSKRLDGDIGYVSLSEFSRGTGENVGKAVQALEAEGRLKGLVFDLRSNPGGLVDEAVFVGSQFIADGVITIEREKGGTEQVFEARPGGLATKVPLVVLMNQGSASASEIVAGAIQEYGRVALIGDQSFGKGTVQIPYELSDGSELRVTIAEWLTPKGRQINGEGITPDIVVKRTQEDFKAGRDPQLERAVQYLQEQK